MVRQARYERELQGQAARYLCFEHAVNRLEVVSMLRGGLAVVSRAYYRMDVTPILTFPLTGERLFEWRLGQVVGDYQGFPQDFTGHAGGDYYYGVAPRAKAYGGGEDAKLVHGDGNAVNRHGGVGGSPAP